MNARAVCAVIALSLLALMGCRADVRHGLDERQANEVQSALQGRGIDAEKVAESGKKPVWTVRVRREQAVDAVRVLADLGLPRQRPPGFSEVFGKGSLVPTPTEERALFLQALSGELAQTLEAVEGVISARVHLVLPPPARPGGPTGESKASALVRVQPGAGDRLVQMRGELCALIAGSVEGLRPDAVTLVVQEVETEGARKEPAVRPVPSRGVTPLLGALVTVLALSMVGLLLRMRATRTTAIQDPEKSRAATAPSRAAGAGR